MKPATLLHLYPRMWRERYAVEMLALIEQSGDHGWQLTSDLVRGSVGAWLMAPLGTWQPPKWLMVLFILGGWAAGLVLLALLTIWLRPAPIAWRVWLAAAALLAVIARLFVKKFEAGRPALAPELAAFETLVLVVVTLVAGTLLHRPVPVEGLPDVRAWFLFVLDPSRVGAPHVWLILAVTRIVWPRGFAALEEDGGETPTSTLGLSA